MSIHTPLTHEVTGSFVLITVIGVVIETKYLSNPSIERLVNSTVSTDEEFVTIAGTTTRYISFMHTVDKNLRTIANED
ncbi:hypothetical protein OAN13_08340, partial [Opitutales bacterium]|nr:hypothetical protein [Opitutales bacterium]